MKRDANDILREEGEDALRAVFDAAATHPLEPFSSPERTPPTNESRAAPLSYVDMTTWDDEPAPPHPWLIRERIPIKSVTLLSGAGSAGKSILSLQLAVAVVLGRGWLNFVPDEAGPVLYVSCEDDAEEVRRRLAPILAMHEASYADLVKGGIRLLCLSGEDAVLAAPDPRSGALVATPLFKQLNNDIVRLRPRAIFFDTSADVFGGSEIDRVQVRRFMSLLRKMAVEAESAVILIAHPSSGRHQERNWYLRQYGLAQFGPRAALPDFRRAGRRDGARQEPAQIGLHEVELFGAR